MESQQPPQHDQLPTAGGDWRRNLKPEARRRVVLKIASILVERVVPISDEERMQELQKIAATFEEKIYNAATDKSDYIRKITLKMLSMESTSNCNVSNAAPSNPANIERDLHFHGDGSNPLLQQQNAIDQRRTLQRIPAVGPSASFDLAPQPGSSVDWQEEVYQKIKVLKDTYFSHLREVYKKICIILQERVSHRGQSRAAAVRKLISVKQVLECCLKYLQVTKSNLKQIHKDKLGDLQTEINRLLRLPSLRKLGSPSLPAPMPGDHEKLKSECSLQWSDGKSRDIQQRISRLLAVVNSMSSKALECSCTAADEHLANMKKHHLEVRDPVMLDEGPGMKRMRHLTSSALLSALSSVDSHNDWFTQLDGSDAFDLDSSAASGLKRCKAKTNPVLLKEMREINEHLIDTVVEISKGGPNLTSRSQGESFVKCSYRPVALCPSSKLYGPAQMPPIQPLRLLVPAAYPNCSPILLDNISQTFSKESNDLSSKAMSRFSHSFRALRQPFSLTKIAREWDACVHSVIIDHAQKMGGGTFTSKHGTTEKCSDIA